MAKLGKKKLQQCRAQTPEIMRDVRSIALNHEVIADSIKVGAIHNNLYLPVTFKIRVLQNVPPTHINEYGVMGVESVHVYFPLDYPNALPQFFLRKDFPRQLPHINPYLGPNNLVSPCFFYGENANLISQPDGFMGMLDRVHEWLHDAALGNLMNETDGWEVQRRDELEGFLVSDTKKLKQKVSDDANAILLESRFIFDKEFSGKDDFHADAISVLVRNTDDVTETTDFNKMSQAWATKFLEAYETVSVFSWPDNQTICDEYAPNDILTLKDLLNFCEKIGCKDAIKEKLITIESKFQASAKAGEDLMVGLILAVRRPYRIQGEKSSIELLPYIMYGIFSKSPVGHPVFSELSPIRALGQRHELNSQLLADLNGTDIEILDKTLHFFGCGSLGSKVVSHLTKAGIQELHLYDKNTFSPHNSARHVLAETGIFSGRNKAVALSNYVRLHFAKSTFNPANVSELLAVPQKIFNAGVLIDTTASPHVSDAISSADWLNQPVIQGGLLGNGSIGFLSRESADRSTRTTDIQAMLSDMRIDDDEIAKFLPKASDNQLVEIGHGCSSRTMVIADDLMSEYSAGMSMIIKEMLKEPAERNATLWLGLAAIGKPGINWQKKTVGLFIKIAADGWDIRVSEPAAQKINELSRQYGDKEFGGVLLGAISTLRRRLTITRVIDAPEDSTYSETEFILGTKGLTDQIIDLKKRSGHELTYLGTWHSHPKGGGPSATDRKSAKNVSELSLGNPSLLLIWTPNGYHAVVEPKA